MPGPLTATIIAAAMSFVSMNRAALVPELQDTHLDDTAMAEMTANGPVILFNPKLYRAAGEAREFVRAHEYGHVLLGHLDDEEMLTTSEGRARAEAEADCFAARASTKESVKAMAKLVRSLPAEPRDAIYGTKAERARRILACAGIEQQG